MDIFERIHVQGFRRLQDVDIPLRPLNVLIGANSSGKTSLLDVFSLLAASASGGLQRHLSEIQGVEPNLSNLKSPSTSSFMQFDLKMSAPSGHPIHYELQISPHGIGFEITSESMTQQRAPAPPPFQHIEARRGNVRYYVPNEGLRAPDWVVKKLESALSQVPKMFQEPEDFRKKLESSTHYHVLDVSKRAPIRLPQQMREASLPGPDGEDIVSCLYTLREAEPDRFEAVEETLRAAFPNFERLNFPPVAAGTLALTWKESTSKHPFYMHQLSEGTLRFLWLVTLLQSPGLTAVTMIDEPEVSLHPDLLSLLADVMREASQRTQLIVATHADRLVRFLQPSEVLTIDVNEDGAAQFKWADELDLEQWLEDYSLDEVWRMGRMGARP